MQLVVDIGSQKLNAGLFEGDRFLQASLLTPEQLLEFLKGKTIQQSLIASQDENKSRGVMSLLTAQGVPCRVLTPANFKRLATDETLSLLQPDRIANIFGALYHFPSNDCVIVDVGATVRLDYITKQGVYLGGAVFSNQLKDFLESSQKVLGENQLEQTKSGAYFGLMGAIERIVAELRLSSETPSAVMSIATGGLTSLPAVQKDLEDFIDKVDPHLTLVGLNQILKEEKL